MSKSQLKRFITQGAMVVAKCIGCNARREIKPGDVPVGEHPMCEKCGMPMTAVAAHKMNVHPKE